MDYNYRLGRMATIFYFILEGIVALLVTLVKGLFGFEYIVESVISWLCALLILISIPQDKEGYKKAFVFLEAIFTMLLSVGIVTALDDAYMLYMLFFLQWSGHLLFLKKYIMELLFVGQGITMGIFCFGLQQFTYIEFFCSVLIMFCVTWNTRIVINIVRKQKEQNLLQKQSLDDMLELVEIKYEEAQSANQAKSSFLANMSHEIRTPINSILGFDTMILRESKTPEVLEYATNIQTAGQGLLSIINDILDFSKIESGKMEIIPVDYDFASMINDVTSMIATKAREKGLHFEIHVDENLPSRMYGDDVRIRQVLINLLTNAVKYTQEGKVVLRVEGERDGSQERVYFSVKDTGSGIKKEHLEQLFAKYVRIEEKRNRNTEGTGLGIHIVTMLLHLMGSSLEVDSEYGIGSEFRFMLVQDITNTEPIGSLERRIRKRATESHYKASYIIPDVSFLVVDDNAMNRKLFWHLLKEFKCKIDDADSGKTCLEMIQKKKYDIIFMDHMMPEMDGIETFHHIKEMENHPNTDTPVVILTANAISGVKEEYLAEGFDDYMSKPVVPEKLENLIGRMISDDRKKFS